MIGRWPHLSVVVDRESTDELSVLVAGHFKLALELEQEELRGAQTGEGGGKSGGTRGGLGWERKWEYHASVSRAPGRVSYVYDNTVGDASRCRLALVGIT